MPASALERDGKYVYATKNLGDAPLTTEFFKILSGEGNHRVVTFYQGDYTTKDSKGVCCAMCLDWIRRKAMGSVKKKILKPSFLNSDHDNPGDFDARMTKKVKRHQLIQDSLETTSYFKKLRGPLYSKFPSHHPQLAALGASSVLDIRTKGLATGKLTAKDRDELFVQKLWDAITKLEYDVGRQITDSEGNDGTEVRPLKKAGTFHFMVHIHGMRGEQKSGAPSGSKDPVALVESIHVMAIEVRHEEPLSGIHLLEPNFGEFRFDLKSGLEGGFKKFMIALMDLYEEWGKFYNGLEVVVLGAPRVVEDGKSEGKDVGDGSKKTKSE
jgi:hypothetical protein